MDAERQKELDRAIALLEQARSIIETTAEGSHEVLPEGRDRSAARITEGALMGATYTIADVIDTVARARNDDWPKTMRQFRKWAGGSSP